VGYNGRDFPPLWDTTEEFFSLCDKMEEVFPLWDTRVKNYTTKNKILKC
jgi:hypothetical protein